MRKLSIFLLCMTLILTPTITGKAMNRDLPTKTKATKEAVLEDAVIDLLQPQIFLAVDDHYGDRTGISFDCERVISIKKLGHPGSWDFEAQLQGITYKGAHDYLDVFTVIIKKDSTTGDKWVMQNYKTRKYKQVDKTECRDPA